MLADGRFPSGGHAHSGGYEAASRALGMESARSLGDYVQLRLDTTGRSDAALIAAIQHRIHNRQPDWPQIDNETHARILSNAQRETSAQLGRYWLRAAKRVWPQLGPSLDAAVVQGRLHQVVAFSVLGCGLALSTQDTITVYLHHLISAMTTAAVRLHGLDPFEAQFVHAQSLTNVATIVTESEALGSVDWSELPAPSLPLTEILAEDHAQWDTRLFQS